MTMSAALVMVLASVIVPSQAKVMVPPPAIAARKAASVQFVTTPPAQAVTGRRSSNATVPPTPRLLSFVNHWFSYPHFVFIEDSFLSFRAVIVLGEPMRALLRDCGNLVKVTEQAGRA